MRALNDAYWQAEAELGRSLTHADEADFMMDAIWLQGSGKGKMEKLTPAPRCGNCSAATSGTDFVGKDAPPTE
ncbi:MAG: hypothetical protein MK135_15665 [Polyangiaceae bacterium]|nr:hypothetical protein [Polyangiaceae bacterium]